MALRSVFRSGMAGMTQARSPSGYPTSGGARRHPPSQPAWFPCDSL